MPRIRTTIGVLACLTLPLAACASSSAQIETTDHTVTVFAAASLGQAGEELITAYRTEHPDVEIIATYAGSSQLVTQMGEGASADLLITADTTTMKTAQANIDALAQASPQVIASNKLVLATAPGNPASVGSVNDLASPGVITALCAPQVPCGRLAQQELAQTDITPAKSTQEANVSAVTTKISSGQADAGFIYSTDAKALSASQNITIIELPGLESNSYPMALTEAGQANPTARDFASWLAESEQASAILTHYGFNPA